MMGRAFSLTAETPEHEADIRKAAEKVEEKYYSYLKIRPETGKEDILAFVALNSFIESFSLRKMMDKDAAEAAALHKELESYLDNIDKI